MIIQYEVVPSHGKEEGWRAFQNARTALLNRDLPTADLLSRLHATAVSYYDLRMPADIADHMHGNLLILDRPDGLELEKEVLGRLSKDEETMNLPIPEFSEKLRQAYIDACTQNTGTKPEIKIPGALRSYGSRSIGNGPWGAVYASHAQVFESPFSELGLQLPDAYYGLSMGLPEIWLLLCSTHQDLMSKARSLDERVLAEAFLQLWGTRVVHPFWDANGRAFGYHLATTLEREGISVPNYGVFTEIVGGLRKVNDEFLKAVLAKGDLRFIQGDEHHLIELKPSLRLNYMTRLRQAMEAGISRGIDPTDRLSIFYFDAAERISEQIANMLGRTYVRVHYPKQDLLETAVRNDPKSVDFYRQLPNEVTALGVAGPEGVIRVSLDDLRLTDAEKSIFDATNKLKALDDRVYQMTYGPICGLINAWNREHPHVSKLLRSAAKPANFRERVVKYLFERTGILAQKRTSDNYVRQGSILHRKLRDAVKTLRESIFIARKEGKILAEDSLNNAVNVAELEREVNDYLGLGNQLMLKYGLNDKSA